MIFFAYLSSLIKDNEKLLKNSQFQFNFHDKCRTNIFSSVNYSKLNKNEIFGNIVNAQNVSYNFQFNPRQTRRKLGRKNLTYFIFCTDNWPLYSGVFHPLVLKRFGRLIFPKVYLA